MRGQGHPAEQAVLQTLLSARGDAAPTAIFILGAPRTGSTVFYQALCSRFALPFIANLTNDSFAETPIVGLSIQKSLPVQIRYDSRYGKTEGPFQPSEGSAVMTRWFGGGHPSALVSARILEGMEPHFLATLAAAEALFAAPLVIKNAWHCFRVPYLAEALPSARFIWIRRDVGAAAKSDLAARYHTKGSAQEWNSATPVNVEDLRRLAPAAQVVENQHAFNTAVAAGLTRHAGGRWREIWYEDFCNDPEAVLTDLDGFLERSPVEGACDIEIGRSGAVDLPAVDGDAIDRYLAEQVERLSADSYAARK
ncbi:sulfotransferase family protein [Pelagibius marinus]|uniref:sulfotransferase family protein n=1 Tax=Pelagibius marinus TaxID=2762760 RepID=UPI001872C826|nr:sulfotransferase [Pelagibius marinus]